MVKYKLTVWVLLIAILDISFFYILVVCLFHMSDCTIPV